MIAGRAMGPPLLVGVVLMLLGSAYLWVRYEVRSGRAPRPA
jgi:hypothetical protein